MELSETNTEQQRLVTLDGKDFTLCQLRIISLSVLGLMRKEIAEYLGNSRHTIDTHLDRVFKLLDIHDSRHLMLWALQHGFDDKGNLNGQYLFDEYNGMPWEGEE